MSEVVHLITEDVNLQASICNLFGLGFGVKIIFIQRGSLGNNGVRHLAKQFENSKDLHTIKRVNLSVRI